MDRTDNEKLNDNDWIVVNYDRMLTECQNATCTRRNWNEITWKTYVSSSPHSVLWPERSKN